VTCLLFVIFACHCRFRCFPTNAFHTFAKRNNGTPDDIAVAHEFEVLVDIFEADALDRIFNSALLYDLHPTKVVIMPARPKCLNARARTWLRSGF